MSSNCCYRKGTA